MPIKNKKRSNKIFENLLKKFQTSNIIAIISKLITLLSLLTSIITINLKV